jgi:hypothetical protein
LSKKIAPLEQIKMETKWLTVAEASEKIRRSPHTIYNWIGKSRQGRIKPKLSLKTVVRKGCSRPGWLIGWNSLVQMDSISPRVKPYVKRIKAEERVYRSDVVRAQDGEKVYQHGDTLEQVIADRKRWVTGWVAEGKPLSRVLAVFNPHLGAEIEGYYWQAVKSSQ